MRHAMRHARASYEGGAAGFQAGFDSLTAALDARDADAAGEWSRGLEGPVRGGTTRTTTTLIQQQVTLTAFTSYRTVFHP